MSYETEKFDSNAVFLRTDGVGFIGFNLYVAILKIGYKVRCLDNLSTGKQRGC